MIYMRHDRNGQNKRTPLFRVSPGQTSAKCGTENVDETKLSEEGCDGIYHVRKSWLHHREQARPTVYDQVEVGTLAMRRVECRVAGVV